MANQNKKTVPGPAIGLYVCGGVMTILFLLSLVGIMLSEQDGTRPFFILSAVVTGVMVAACLISARWLTEKASSKKPVFASYAFEGEFAPKKEAPAPQMPKKTKKH